MTVLFVMTGACATSGGIATHNRQILRALIRYAIERHIQVTIFSFLENDDDRPSFLPAFVKFRGFAGEKSVLARALIARGLENNVFVFDHVTLATPLLPFIASGWIKAVIFAHGSESWKRIRLSSRWLFAGARLVLTNSQYTLNKMRQRGVRGNIVTCPLGLAPEFVLNSEPPLVTMLPHSSLVNASGEERPLGPRFCLLVGRMHPQEREKGHYQLLAAWPDIIREFPDAQLVFAGPGEDRKNVASVARKNGIGSSIFVPGVLRFDELQRLYAGAYAFTMPSKQEGFGLVYLEAMNAAKPCLGCWDDGAEDVIVHDETGLLITNPHDTSELAGAVLRLLRDPEAAREMGRRGFKRLHQHFTAAHVQQRLYEQLSKVF